MVLFRMIVSSSFRPSLAGPRNNDSLRVAVEGSCIMTTRSPHSPPRCAQRRSGCRCCGHFSRLERGPAPRLWRSESASHVWALAVTLVHVDPAIWCSCWCCVCARALSLVMYSDAYKSRMYLIACSLPWDMIVDPMNSAVSLPQLLSIGPFTCCTKAMQGTQFSKMPSTMATIMFDQYVSLSFATSHISSTYAWCSSHLTSVCWAASVRQLIRIRACAFNCRTVDWSVWTFSTLREFLNLMMIPTPSCPKILPFSTSVMFRKIQARQVFSQRLSVLRAVRIEV